MRKYFPCLTSLQILRSQKGVVTLISALSFVVFLGIAALVVDLGIIYLNRNQVANAADAAALAGAKDLPGHTDLALANAHQYAVTNGKAGDIIVPLLSDNNTTLSITITRKVPLIFAQVFGKDSVIINASATAKVMPFKGGGIGIVPWGIEKQTLVYGQTYTLKLGGGSGYNGNFQALALGATGANNYRDNIINGYQGTYRIGDWIQTETGNMSGPTKSGVNSRISRDPTATFDTVQSNSARIIIVPVIDSLQVSGRTDVLIVGFAAFFLEGAGGGGNDCFVYGKFRQMVIPGEAADASTTSYGLYAVVLTK